MYALGHTAFFLKKSILYWDDLKKPILFGEKKNE